MWTEIEGITLTDEIPVRKINTCGSDAEIICAAKTSVDPGEALAVLHEITNNPGKTEEHLGLINYLMSSRHGGPFEQGFIQHIVTAPIFIWREHHRHRVGWSYSEQSARYRPLQPIFWVPNDERKMIPIPDPGIKCLKFHPAGDGSCGGLLKRIRGGTKVCTECGEEYRYHVPARPLYQKSNYEKGTDVRNGLAQAYRFAYGEYSRLMSENVAKEVARGCLPVAIFSTCWTACNPRSMMHFLSLRTYEKTARFVSFPQAEIEQVARVYEETLKDNWPLTYKAFCDNGRVCP